MLSIITIFSYTISLGSCRLHGVTSLYGKKLSLLRALRLRTRSKDNEAAVKLELQLRS